MRRPHTHSHTDTPTPTHPHRHPTHTHRHTHTPTPPTHTHRHTRTPKHAHRHTRAHARANQSRLCGIKPVGSPQSGPGSFPTASFSCSSTSRARSLANPRVRSAQRPRGGWARRGGAPRLASSLHPCTKSSPGSFPLPFPVPSGSLRHPSLGSVALGTPRGGCGSTAVRPPPPLQATRSPPPTHPATLVTLVTSGGGGAAGPKAPSCRLAGLGRLPSSGPSTSFLARKRIKKIQVYSQPSPPPIFSFLFFLSLFLFRTLYFRVDAHGLPHQSLVLSFCLRIYYCCEETP